MTRFLTSRIGSRLRWEVTRTSRAVRLAANALLATRFYDLVTARAVRIHPGALEARRAVAVYAIFPRHGLQPSHLRSLRYLAAKGLAPVVVSNLSLAAPDREALLASCWRLIERPNFGYDFGAYREAMLMLGASLLDLERLILTNDSVWFPVSPHSDWLDDAERLDASFVGAVSNCGIAQVEPGDYRAIDWSFDPSRPDFHYCSFALHISGPVVADPGFLRFWKRLKLTDSKFFTVRRGEVGLSQWVMQRGHSHASTFDLGGLGDRLRALPAARLRDVIDGLVIPEEPPLIALKHAMLARCDASSAWHEDAVRFLLAAIARTGAAYALPEYALREGGYAFLKKSPLWLDPDAAATTLRIIARLDPLVPELLDEARSLLRPAA